MPDPQFIFADALALCFSPTTVSDEALDYSPTLRIGCARHATASDEVLDTPRQTDKRPSVFRVWHVLR